jgi:hypothetical protein
MAEPRKGANVENSLYEVVLKIILTSFMVYFNRI